MLPGNLLPTIAVEVEVNAALVTDRTCSLGNCRSATELSRNGAGVSGGRAGRQRRLALRRDDHKPAPRHPRRVAVHDLAGAGPELVAADRCLVRGPKIRFLQCEVEREEEAPRKGDADDGPVAGP